MRISAKDTLVVGLFLSSLVGCTSDVEVETVRGSTSTSNPYVPDSITYAFINYALFQEFKDLNFSCDYVLDRHFAPATLTDEDSLYLLSMDSVFSVKDMEFMYKQVAKGDKFSINSASIGDRVLVSLDTIIAEAKGKTKFKAFRDSYGGEGFCYITMLVFSKNYSYAIVRKGMVCGNICGEEETQIFKSVNGQWQLFYAFGSEEI